MTSGDQIAQLLEKADEPMSDEAIASFLKVSVEEVDQVLWSDPHRFHWHAGGLWALAKEKAKPPLEPVDSRPVDVRTVEGRLKEGKVELRAIVLDDGTSLKVSKKPLDGEVLFIPRRFGSELEIVINSAHDALGSHPVPFAEEKEGSAGELLELLIEAWALVEDSMEGTQAKRGLEDARSLMGRRMGELARKRNA